MRSGTLVRRRQLARILRELRLKSGLTIEETAPKLDFSAFVAGVRAGEFDS